MSEPNQAMANDDVLRELADLKSKHDVLEAHYETLRREVAALAEERGKRASAAIAADVLVVSPEELAELNGTGIPLRQVLAEVQQILQGT